MDQDSPTQPGGEYIPPSPGSAYPPAKTSGMAIAALVLALLGITAIPALVLGIIALVQIDRRPGQAGGRGLAIASLIISGLWILVIPVIAIMSAIMFPVFSRARAEAKTSSCLSNVKMLSVAVTMYASDNDGRYPPPGSWDKATEPYMKSAGMILHCPSSTQPGRSYAMNANLAGMNEDKVANPQDLVMIFDAKDGAPESGGPELVPSPPRHPRGNNFGFVDGHARYLPPAGYSTFTWQVKKAK